MSPERWILQVSAGTGPVEVRRFAGLLGLWLESEALGRGLEVLDSSSQGKPREPTSVELMLEGDALRRLGDLIGTHELLARGPGRGRSSRKRWYAGVALFPCPSSERVGEEAELEKHVRLSAARSGGPGGQHVNKTSSAIRAVHEPTGLAVRARRQRSQHANRREALSRLREKLERRAMETEARSMERRREVHHALVRGNPVRRWRLEERSGPPGCPRLVEADGMASGKRR